jgi:peptide/nickel transport system permease protein
MTTELVPLQVEPFEANSGREAWRLFVRNRAALCGLVLFTSILLATFIGPLLYTADPFNTATSPLLPPGHPDAPLLGSDELGRDILAGLLNGAR